MKKQSPASSGPHSTHRPRNCLSGDPANFLLRSGALVPEPKHPELRTKASAQGEGAQGEAILKEWHWSMPLSVETTVAESEFDRLFL